MRKAYPNLFSPFKVGKFTYKNRILSAPVSQPFYTDKDRISIPAFAYLEEQAKGGVAQVTIGDQPIDPKLSFGKGFDINRKEIPNDVLLSLSAFTFAIHQHGALVSIELGHPGEGMHFPPGFKGHAIGPMGYTREEDGIEVVALDEAMMDEVCEMFALCAANLKKVGFDGCVIHGGHGCLIAQFLSSRTNKRSDKFGGSMENRARFPIMILDRVRERAGKDFIIELRVSGDELIDDGIHVEDNIAFCKLIEGKVDLIHVSAGIYHVPELFVRTHSSIYYPSACNAYLAEAIRKEINIPVITVGAINDPDIAERIIATGQADFVALGRQLIADPFFARKAQDGRAEEITPCIRCLNCMAGGEPGSDNLRCSVNPRASREYRIPGESTAAVSRKVVVIGGGPGGMKAAITATERGHKVILFEKSGFLGGTLQFTDKDVCKFDLRRYKDHLINRVNALNIDVRLNTEATAELVESENAYAVIAAVGAERIIPSIPGINGKNVIHAVDAYEDINRVGDSVIIVGGGLVGCETGIHLAKLGKKITLIEMTCEVAADCRNAHKIALMEQLRKLNVQTGLKCTGISGGIVKAKDKNGKDVSFEADTVVYALGMAPREDEAAKFMNTAVHYFTIGDCVKAGKVVDAVQQGYFAALDI